MRLAAYFQFWTKDQINLYVPLIQPLCLSLLGTIFLANAYSDGKTVPKQRRGWRLWSWLRCLASVVLAPVLVAMHHEPGPARERHGDHTELRKRPFGDVTDSCGPQ